MLVKMEEHEAHAFKLQLRPQSASLVAEIMAEEGAKAKQLYFERKAKEKRMQLQAASAWSSLDMPSSFVAGVGNDSSAVLGVGEFSSDLFAGDSGGNTVPSRRHPMLPTSMISNKSSFVAPQEESWEEKAPRPSTAGARLGEARAVAVKSVGSSSGDKEGRAGDNQAVSGQKQRARHAIVVK
jgi:hypothetical protein